MTQFSLEGHFRKYTESPLLQYIVSKGILHGILDRSELMELRFEKATKRVQTRLVGGNAIFKFFKWYYQKDSILDLFPEMDSLKVSLLLLMSATQLEVLDMECNNSLSDREKLIFNEKHIRRLKKSIRDNLETLKRLESQTARVNQFMPMGPLVHQAQSVSSLYEILLPLGRSMVKTGSVPKPKFVSATPSESSTRTKEVIFHVQAGRSMPSVSSAPSRGADSQKQACHHDHEALYKLERRLQHERLSRNRSSSAKTTPSSPTGPPATLRDVDYGSGASSNTRDKEARSVHASQLQRQQVGTLPKTPIVHAVNTANSYKSIVRSLVSRNGKPSGKVLTGVVNTTLEVNVISILEAERVGASLVPCQEDQEIKFKFDSGKSQPCIGIVYFIIYHNSMLGSQSPTTRHKFYVLENCHPRLIFGKDILEIEEALKQ
ncbi:hypothetical protein CNYM01_08895 [Colletotrichum nymphaeae SA-01]|uniref:Uncharacterized protein n=1 Tax=Colletotrichum nymphaeae SA-01 TaxID=1460502 RepID=A0A135ST50_9PEZI|nr:hypothetical protein CNYM01_08895 [Colletotrichum nymphaeae SA-01]